MKKPESHPPHPHNESVVIKDTSLPIHDYTRSSMQTRDGLLNTLTTPKRDLEGHVLELHPGESAPNHLYQINDHDNGGGAPGYNTAKGMAQQISENSRQSQSNVNRSMGSLQMNKAGSIQGNFYGTTPGPSQSQILVDTSQSSQKPDQKRLLLQSLAQANGGVGVSTSLTSQQQHTPSSQFKKNSAYVKPPIAGGMSTSQSQSQFNLGKSKGQIPPSHHQAASNSHIHEDLEGDGDDDSQMRRINRTQDPKKAIPRRTFDSSADKIKQQPNKNVSPYSIKTLPKFPRQTNGGGLQSSSVHSDSKTKKNLSTHLANVAGPTSSTQAELIQPVLHPQNAQQVPFKSTTSFSQGDPAGLNAMKQHLPPLEPKGPNMDTPGGQNQSSKKKFVKNGPGQQEANSFLDSAQRGAGVNIKRIVPTTLDYDQQLLSEEDLSQLDQQPLQHDNFMYRRISNNGDQKLNQPQRYNPKHHQSHYNSSQGGHETMHSLVPPQVQNRDRGNNSNSKSKGPHSSSLTKNKRKGGAAQDHSPNLMQPSRNMIDPRVGVFQSQNLMLVHDPSRVSPQPRPHESHSHTRTMKFRYQQQNQLQSSSQQKKGLMFMPNQGSLMDLPVAHTMEYRKGSKNRPNKHHDSDIPLQTLPGAGMKYQNFHTFDNNLGPLSQFSDRLNSGIPRDSIFHGLNNHDPMMSNEGLFSGDRGFQFSDRFSSIEHDKQQDDLENTIKIGRGGSGDSDEDVKLFRDVEIRLKIEPLSLKLLQNITERIRQHMLHQGKPALSNLVGLLYQQCVKLTQRMTVSSPSMISDQSRTIIKNLQLKNQELNSELGALQSEVRALRIGQGIDGGARDAGERSPQKGDGGGNAYYVHQVQELKRRNYELQNDMEQLRERLQMYENMSENEADQPSKTNQPPQKVEIIKTKIPAGVPKLNLQKALQLNMKMFKSHQPQFQVPLESSNRGSYMSFKLQQQNFAADEEGMPVSQNLNQPLVRPTTTMGGRKKLVFNKGTSNEEQIIEEKHNSSDLSEVSGDHSLGGGGPSHPNIDSIQRPMHKKIKLKKLTTQKLEESSSQIPSLLPKNAAGINSNQPGVVTMSMKKLPGRQKGFHDEFMEKYDEFSVSWREAIDREKRF